MIKLCYMDGRWIGMKIKSVANSAKNIQMHTDVGIPVLLINNIEEVEEIIDIVEIKWI